MSKLLFRWGTMNSSKSAQLIMTAYNYGKQGKSYIVFKPSLDTRDEGVIKSRALNTEIKAITILADELGTMYSLVENLRPHAVFLDEIQFMTEMQIEELARIADELDIPVICYGLKVDFQSRLFEGSKRLIELADELEEIDNECSECGNKSSQNMRLLNGKPVFHGEQVQVGKEESYSSICRTCYMKHKKGAENNGRQ